MLLLRVWHGEPNPPARHGSPKRSGRGGRRATLADSASELSSDVLEILLFEVLMHYIQAMRDCACKELRFAASARI